MEKALKGLKVLDFTWVIAGPTATKVLAEYGATVVKVESTKRLDLYRAYAPYAGGVRGVNRSYAFSWYNSGKCGTTLNLNHPRGVELARRLAGWADVLVENFTAGTLERWGLGYNELKKINPKLIVVRASMQGQTGPYAGQPGFGIMMQAAGGFIQLAGWPDRPPVQPPVPMTDYAGAWYIASLTLAALDERARTGKGMYIDLSQLEAGIMTLAPAVLSYSANRHNPERQGNRCPYSAPHGVFRCRGEERWCAISVSNDREWSGLCRVIAEPWTAGSRFSTLLDRKRNEDELERRVDSWTSIRAAEEVMAFMQQAGVPAGVVKDSKDITNDPQLAYRGHFRTLNHTDMGDYVNAEFSFRMSQTPAGVTPSPCLGEHNRYVFQDLLGVTDEEFAGLVADGVLD